MGLRVSHDDLELSWDTGASTNYFYDKLDFSIREHVNYSSAELSSDVLTRQNVRKLYSKCKRA